MNAPGILCTRTSLNNQDMKLCKWNEKSTDKLEGKKQEGNDLTLKKSMDVFILLKVLKDERNRQLASFINTYY